jgi:hypothetical protein
MVAKNNSALFTIININDMFAVYNINFTVCVTMPELKTVMLITPKLKNKKNAKNTKNE